MERRDDDRLFEDFRARGDTGALATLFDRAAPELLRVAVHLTGDLGDAEDLVQDTFVAAIRGARRYRAQGRVRGWLAGILQNHARRLRRRRRRRGAAIEVELADPLPVDGLESATAAERRSIARDALERVPEPYRSVLGLRYAHGFSVAEIAAALDRPANTVQSQLQRGTERLRRMLPGEAGLAALAAFSTDGLGAVRALVLAEATRVVAAGTAVVGVATNVRAAVAGVAALLVFGFAVPWAFAWLDIEGAERPASPRAVDVPAVAAAEPRDEPDGDRLERAALDDPPDVATLGGQLVELRVVEAGTGRAVPGARVTAFDAGAQTRIDGLGPEEWQRSADLFASDLEAYQLRFGVEHVADAGGVVRVPQNQAWGAMAARSGTLYGERNGDESDRIVVAPDRELRVRVVDHAGRPAVGVAIGLGDGALGAELLAGNRHWLRAETGDAGVAVFRHVQVPALELGDRRGRQEMSVVVFAPGLFPTPVHRVPLGGVLPSVLDVRLPPAGSAEVRVVDARGGLVGPDARWRLDVDVVVHGSDGRGSAVVGADGVARFAFLPVGRPLTFSASLGGYLTPDVEHPGLRQGGEQLVLEIPFGRDAATIFGRAVDADGRALGGVPLLARVAGDDARREHRVDTDADGAFRVVVPIDDRSGALGLMTLHRIALKRRGPIELDERLLGSAATLRGVLLEVGAVHDAGDVVFAAPPRLGAGTWRVDPPELADRALWLEPEVEQRAGPGEAWAPIDGAFVAWHADGTFVVHGVASAGAVRVRGRSILGDNGSEPLELAPLEFAPGARDLHVDVVAGSELVVDFVGPRGALRFDLMPADGVWPAHDGHALVDRPADNAVITVGAGPGRTAPLVGPLWPGRYRVVVRAVGVDEPVLEIDALDVPAGARVRPLVDAPLDVSAWLRFVDLTLVDAAGDPIRNGTVWLRELATGRVERAALENGRFVRAVRGGWQAVATAPRGGFVVFDAADPLPVTVPRRGRVTTASGVDLPAAAHDWPEIPELAAAQR